MKTIRGRIRARSHWVQLIDKNVWIAMLSLLIIHFLMLALQFHYDLYELMHDKKAEQAFQQLVLTAAQTLPLEKLQRTLKDINNSTPQIGNSKITVSLDNRPRTDQALQLPHFTQNNQITTLFPYYIDKDHWLNYTESPVNTIYKYLVILVLFEMLLIGLVFFYAYIISRFTKSLRNFKLSAENLGIHLNTHQLEEDAPSVVQETADAINRMQQRIQDLINTRTQLLASISHDLRTPITRIRLRNELIEDQEQTEKIAADLTEMETMITEVLNFASNDIVREPKIKLDMNALLLSIFHDFKDRNEKIHYTERRARSHFMGGTVSLKRVFTNLIGNALKYAGEAWVKLVYQDNKIIITIEDNGPGIPEEELTQVFEPYYRSARTITNKPGTGLGMTIAYEIIHAHSGTISLQNRAEGGLRVTITLPNNV